MGEKQKVVLEKGKRGQRKMMPRRRLATKKTKGGKEEFRAENP